MKLYKVTFEETEYLGRHSIYFAAPSFAKLANHLVKEDVVNIEEISDHIAIVK